MALTIIDERDPRRGIDYEARTVHVPPDRVYQLDVERGVWTTTHPLTGARWAIPLEPRGDGGWIVATRDGGAAMLVGRTWVDGCEKLGLSPLP